jgi:hypothetical protein
MNPFLAMLKAASFYFLHNISTLNELRMQSCVIFVCKHNEQCLIPSPKIAFCFTDLSRLILEIFKFFENHAQNLNTPQNKARFMLQRAVCETAIVRDTPMFCVIIF